MFWFGQCYDVASDWSGVRWTRTALPQVGGLGDQDAWLIDALAELASIMTTLARSEAKHGHAAHEDPDE